MLTTSQFERIWRGSFDGHLRYACRLGLDISSAEDVIQDVAIEALRRLDKFQDEGHFFRWCTATIRFRSLDALGLRLSSLEWEPEAPVSTTDEVDEASILAIEEIREAIKELPERQRIILERALAGDKTSEIAEELTIDDATVRSQKRNAITKIKFRLWGRREQKS